jgi:hypothetical protein
MKKYISRPKVIETEELSGRLMVYINDRTNDIMFRFTFDNSEEMVPVIVYYTPLGIKISLGIERENV